MPLPPSPDSEPSDHAPDESYSSQGLSPAAWAAISAIAVALISGLVTIIVTLFPETIKSSPTAEEPGAPLPPTDNADAVTIAIAGHWVGDAKGSGGETYPLEVTITEDCQINQKCGIISVLSIPCYGELFLKTIHQQEYEFDIKNFNNASDQSCEPGGGEYFTLLADGSLAYRADWGVRGILDPMP